MMKLKRKILTMIKVFQTILYIDTHGENLEIKCKEYELVKQHHL